ncbi:hypothetical protein Aperf_G00000052269 [Anoplocephala perfoliata]
MGNSLDVLPEDPNWPYADSPWDLFRDCQSWASGAPNASSYQGACILSHILGFVSAYIFPFVGLLGVFSNIFITYVFLLVFRKPSRQVICLACVSAADVITIILFGWLSTFPAKGLPYATGAHVYFFIFNINTYSCKIVRYLYSFSSCASSSIFLLTSLDRCLSIYFPLQFARISRKRAWEASWASGAPNASSYQAACILSHILGFVSAYIFPFFGLVGIISNIFIIYVFLLVSRKPSRQMIYLACVSAADVLTIIIFGWIWMFPAKGLPYATGARLISFPSHRN